MSFKLLKVVRDAFGCVRIGKTALVAAVLCVATVPSPSLATDLEGFYLRHDFSSGARETSYGPNSSATKDIGSATATAVYGPDGADTAVHPGDAWNDIFGSNNASSLVNSDWSVAASVRCARVEGGVVFSLGRMNGNLKEVVLCSSSTNGKLYLKVLKRNGSSRTVESSTEATVADTQDGYHAVVLIYKATATGQGTFTLYFDGAQVATVEATSSTPFGNGFQYSTLLSTTPSDYPNLGCANVSGNTALAFQDMRIFTSALTAEDVAAYVALYPTTLPAFTENLDQYAYVQSYGANAIDTGYLAKTDTVFAVDFEYTDVSTKQDRIFGCYSSYNKTSGVSNDGLTSGLYINGSGQFAFAKFSTYASGGTWMTFAGQPVGDTKRRVFSTKDVSVSETTGTLSLYDRSDAKSGMTTADHGTGAINPIYLFANNSKNGDANYNSNAKIYSFGASEGTVDPAIFLAPAEENGAAGFRDIVSGAFYGDIVDSPSQALTYQSGIGQASDYRYRSGKFYARIYAVSADASQGLVKFEGGEAAGTNAQFTARGRTAKISAVLPSGGTPIVEWSGDTWAITDGTIYDSTITVKSDTAIRLVATVSEAPVWKNNDGTGSLDSAENWTRVPGSGEDAVLELSGDTAITCAEAKTFGKMTITGAYSADFSGAETVTLSGIEFIGVTNLVTGGKLLFPAINIPSGCTVTITGAEGIGHGGLTGVGTLVIDPGADNTYTMSKNNTDYTGAVIVKSGVVKFGDYQSFGKIGRDVFIRVCAGAVLDENGQTYYPDPGVPLSKAILEEGAELRSNPGYGQLQYSALTTLNLEGNATIDTSFGNVTISERWNDHAVKLDLNAYTLTVKGNNKFGVSYCTISGTGTLDIQSGATVESTHDFDNVTVSTTCADGTIHIREGGKWNLANYQDKVSRLSVKNLILEGVVTRAVNTYTLTVTGSITGNGTTPMLKMDTGAVFKPTGTGYLTITESLSGTMTIDLSGLELPAGSIPLFKVGSAAMLPAENEIAFAAGFDTKGWRLRKTRDGLGYDLARAGFTIMIR